MKIRVMTDDEFAQWMVKNLHAYFCDECEERFWIERIEYPNEMKCPLCSGEVSINSGDFGKLEQY